MGQATSIVDTVSCRTAVDFLIELLGPDSKYFNAQPYDWIFRGVAKSEYQLIPSALRGGAFSRFALHTKEWQQIKHEWEVVKTFYELANLRGLRLPEASQRILELIQTFDPELKDGKGGEEPIWPPSDLLPLCGLAQHYGVPTRLLDWTYDPSIAAYFAASNVMKQQYEIAPVMQEAVRRYLTQTGVDVDEGILREEFASTKYTIAVWAMFRPFYKGLKRRTEFRPGVDQMPYEMITVPYASNPNMQARQGVFTVVRHRGSPETIDRSTLDQTLLE